MNTSDDMYKGELKLDGGGLQSECLLYISFTSVINEFMYKLLFNKIQSLSEKGIRFPLPKILFQLHCI